MHKLGSLKSKCGWNMLQCVYINFGMKQKPFPLFPPSPPLSLYAADVHPATNDGQFHSSQPMPQPDASRAQLKRQDCLR